MCLQFFSPFLPNRSYAIYTSSFSKLEIIPHQYIKNITTVFVVGFFCGSFILSLVHNTMMHLIINVVVDLMKRGINIDEHAAWIDLKISCNHLPSNHCPPSLPIIGTLLDFFKFYQPERNGMVFKCSF